MIARFLLALPFHITVPEPLPFAIVDEYDDEGYKVTVFPPCKSNRSPPADVLHGLCTRSREAEDFVPAVFTDALHIEFQKDAFNRLPDSPLDPPEAVITRAIDSFLTRLSYVTQAAEPRAVDWSHSTWRLRYLNEDGTERPQDAKLRNERSNRKQAFSYVGLDEQTLKDMHSLPRDYVPPAWNGLLIDAEAALPHVGTAVVLAATSLEVFIAEILNKLAAKSRLCPDLWTWLNDRDGKWLREPALEEQFDTLLKYFTGHSLKEEALWEAFKNLKTARNTFVHEGCAKDSAKRGHGKPVSPAEAAKLVDGARAIISWVRNRLPEDLQWPEFLKQGRFRGMEGPDASHGLECVF
jgi:hypothetical protein